MPSTSSTRGVEELWREALITFYGNTVPPEDQASTTGDIIIKINKDNRSFGAWRHDEGSLDKLRILVKTGLKPINVMGNAIASAVSPVFPPSTAIYTAITVLISTSNSVSDDFDALVTLFTELGNFLKIFGILETTLRSIPSIEEVQQALVAALKSILSICAVAKSLKKGRIRHGIRELFGNDAGLKEARNKFQDATKQVKDSLLAKVFVNSEAFEYERQKSSKTAYLRDSLEIVRLHFETKVDPAADWAITNPQLPLIDIRRSSIVERGNWILMKREYSEWAKEKVRILWISGEPGTGKSHIASTIIKDLSQKRTRQSRSSTAYFFFKFTSLQTRLIENAFRSFIIQIAQDDEIFCERVARRLEANGLGVDSPMSKKDRLKKLWNRRFIEEFSANCEKLLTVLGKQSLRIQVVILGRPEFESAFDAADTTYQTKISITQNDNRSDLENLVHSTYDSMDDFRSFKPFLRTKITHAVIKSSQGALLYIEPVLRLLSERGPQALRHTLKTLPKGQDQMYQMVLERTLARASPPQEEVIKFMLRWVLHVKDPLSFRELQSLHDMSTQDNEWYIQGLIRSRCRSILSWREPVFDESEDDRDWDESASESEFDSDGFDNNSESVDDQDSFDSSSEDSEQESEELVFSREFKEGQSQRITKDEPDIEEEEDVEEEEEEDEQERTTRRRNRRSFDNYDSDSDSYSDSSSDSSSGSEEDDDDDGEVSRARIELIHASLGDYLSRTETKEDHQSLVTSRSEAIFEIALITLKATCDRTVGGRYFRKYAFAHWLDHLLDVEIDLTTDTQVEEIIACILELLQKAEPPIPQRTIKYTAT